MSRLIVVASVAAATVAVLGGCAAQPVAHEASAAAKPTKHQQAVRPTHVVSSPVDSATHTATHRKTADQATPDTHPAAAGSMAPSAPATCTGAQLTGSVGAGAVATGHALAVVVLTNTGPVCQMVGYPDVAMFSSTQQQLQVSSSQGPDMLFPATSAQTVTLQTGERASFSLGYATVPAGDQTTCPQATTLRITSPGAADTVTVATQLSPCGKQADVSAIVAGSNGVRS